MRKTFDKLNAKCSIAEWLPRAERERLTAGMSAHIMKRIPDLGSAGPAAFAQNARYVALRGFWLDKPAARYYAIVCSKNKGGRRAARECAR